MSNRTFPALPVDMADDITPAADEAAPAPLKPKRSYVTAIVIAVGLLGGGGFGTFVSGPRLANRMVRPAGAATAPASEEHSEKPTGQAVVLLDNLVLNPAGSGGLRFLLVTVGVQLSNGASAEMLKTHDAEARDIVLRIFGTRRVDELAEIRMRDGLKREIMTAIDSLLGTRIVKGVYFPQFVIQ